MDHEEELIKINLEINHNKDDFKELKGFKAYLFEALYLIEQNHGLYKFWDILFTIIEFIQLMAFSMDKTFDESWGNHWVKTIGNFFRFFQLIFLWKKTSFFIITFIITCIYLILLVSFFSYVIAKSFKYTPIKIIKILVLILQINIFLHIPILKTLFSSFSCKNNFLEVYPEIKYKSNMHIILIVISAILIIIYQILIVIFHSTLYGFGVDMNKFKSGYTPSTEILLDIIKLVLIIFYQFISHQLVLSIITLILSIILLIHFLFEIPYSNGFTIKLYLILYAFFFWSCILCIISIFLKNSNFRSGIVLLTLGYPLILAFTFLTDLEFYADQFFPFDLSNNKNIIKINYLLKLEESFDQIVKTKEFKLLYCYIGDYETTCIEKDCYLKQFLNLPLKKENFENLKLLLLYHVESIYKKEIFKNPKDIKLRIAYILFLFEKLNRKIKAKNELIFLTKFELNLEYSFLIYKLKKFFENNMNKELNPNEINSKNFANKLNS